jgi:3-oxoacyl-[acyl-carrier-protein] synthase III
VTGRAAIFGVGAALPDDVVTNAELTERLDTTDEWIFKRTGIRERRRLNGRVSLTELAAQACTEALRDAGRDAAEVDRVVVATMTADLITPGLAPGVAAAVGAHGAGAIDLNAACMGFLAALEQAAALVESGRAEVVLVCGAEALSRITDPEDRGTAVLFGDGAGAVVVARGDVSLGCAPFEMHSDGTHAGLLYADTTERMLRMEGREVYRHAVRRMAEATRDALRRAGMTVENLDLFVAHQANARILEATARELGLPDDRLVVDVDRVANTSSASIPLALWRAERDGRLPNGATVGLAAFGAGFVWGAGVISWKERVPVYA